MSLDFRHPESFSLLLVGEVCTDQFIEGSVKRVSPEAPIPILEDTEAEQRLGMSGNVKSNLEIFGARVVHKGNNPFDLMRTRYIDRASRQQILRVDENKPIKPLRSFPSPNKFDAVIISDYNRGLLDNRSIDLINDLYHGLPIFVDTKREDVGRFKDCVMKIGNNDNVDTTTIDPSVTVAWTMGEGGASCNGHFYRAPEVDVFDVTGAGDVFLASLAILTLCGYRWDSAMQNAVNLATISVQHHGTYTLTHFDIDRGIR